MCYIVSIATRGAIADIIFISVFLWLVVLFRSASDMTQVTVVNIQFMGNSNFIMHITYVSAFCVFMVLKG